MEFENEIPGHEVPVNEMSLFAEMSGNRGDSFSGMLNEYSCVFQQLVSTFCYMYM